MLLSRLFLAPFLAMLLLFHVSLSLPVVNYVHIHTIHTSPPCPAGYTEELATTNAWVAKLRAIQRHALASRAENTTANHTTLQSSDARNGGVLHPSEVSGGALLRLVSVPLSLLYMIADPAAEIRAVGRSPVKFCAELVQPQQSFLPFRSGGMLSLTFAL